MSKPILSELEYNASDVASAILSQADLSVTNQDFAVTDRTDNFDIQSGWTDNGSKMFSFNGFMFISIFIYHSVDEPSEGEVAFQVDTSDLYPDGDYYFNTISGAGDLANYLKFNSSGELSVHGPEDHGDTLFRVVTNGFYRF
tara:strand:- start:1046 stop:1471 length:426 start_codon:yes stop_codon:yes gene_type:complete